MNNVLSLQMLASSDLATGCGSHVSCASAASCVSTVSGVIKEY